MQADARDLLEQLSANDRRYAELRNAPRDHVIVLALGLMERIQHTAHAESARAHWRKWTGQPW